MEDLSIRIWWLPMLPWTDQQGLCEEEDHKGGFLWPDLQVSYIPLPISIGQNFIT